VTQFSDQRCSVRKFSLQFRSPPRFDPLIERDDQHRDGRYSSLNELRECGLQLNENSRMYQKDSHVRSFILFFSSIHRVSLAHSLPVTLLALAIPIMCACVFYPCICSGNLLAQYSLSPEVPESFIEICRVSYRFFALIVIMIVNNIAAEKESQLESYIRVELFKFRIVS